MRAAARILATMADVLRGAAVAMLIPVPVALAYDPYDLPFGPVHVPAALPVFVAAAAALWMIGEAMRIATKPESFVLNEKESYMAIAAAWLVASLAAMLPFLVFFRHPVDAWFEAMSGITTTGATILADVESVAPSLLFWRSLLQFIGGLGFVIAAVALLTRLTHGGLELLATDVAKEGRRLRPRLKETARGLWPLYLGVSGVLFVGYWATMYLTAPRMGAKQVLFDALIHTFGTISTGGFSNRQGNLGYYNSPAVEGVAVVGMLVAGTSFALLYYVRNHPRRVIQDREWRAYATAVALAAAGAVGLLWLAGDGLLEGLRAGVVTTVSIVTTTGYVVADHDTWPILARSLLLVAMLMGAMAGSTAGGLKVLRITLLLQVARREIRKLLHPRAVISIRHGAKPVPEQTMLTIIAFFFTYVTIWLFMTMILTATETRLGLFDSAGAAAAALSNVGPAMGVVGPFDHYGSLHASSKVLLGLMMWVGRLEIFAVLLFFSPSSWKS